MSRLVRDKDRIFLGEAKVAFYRPGHQAAPTFSVTFMRAVKGIQRGVMLSDTAWVDITPVLPPGDQPLKDIRPLAANPAPRWPWLALLVAVGAGTSGSSGGASRRRPSPALPARRTPKGRSALEDALDRLIAIEREQWPAHGEIERHYEEVANVVRDFWPESEQSPARS